MPIINKNRLIRMNRKPNNSYLSNNRYIKIKIKMIRLLIINRMYQNWLQMAMYIVLNFNFDKIVKFSIKYWIVNSEIGSKRIRGRNWSRRRS
jgi:hypothetical protein